MATTIFSNVTTTWSSQELFQTIYQVLLQTTNDTREAEALTQRLLQHYRAFDLTDRLIARPIVISPQMAQTLNQALHRLQQQEPLQYVLGTAPFLGREFIVNKHVLIPRPETAEMVQEIIQTQPKPGLRVLDIGTGSGCIAISLQKELKRASVMGIDNSPEALAVAQENAQKNNATVTFQQLDILENATTLSNHWDLIVSNPPYVCCSEQKYMERHVLDYEPAQALFVPDEDPLLFYKAIAALPMPAARLYVEINERFVTAVKYLLRARHFTQISCKKDLQNKPRWITATFPR